MFAPLGWWWRRRCGGRAVLAIALPLLVSTASWTIMNFMDRMFLSWFSEEAFAASMPAGMLQFTVFCFPLGIATYANTFVAQYYGAGRPERIGLAMAQAVRFGLWTTPLFLLAVPVAPFFFEHVAGQPPEIAPLEAVYYQVLSFGAGAAVLAGALSSFFTGLGRTRVVMCVMVGTTLLNVLLDWLWIFGKWGFPEMGIAGAGLATTVAQWCRVALYWALMMRSENRKKFGLSYRMPYDRQLMRRLLRFGGPSGLQMVIECSGFAVFLLLLGHLGKDAMTATTLAFNVNSVAFVPMLGLGIAVSTMVGQQLGANRPRLAARATWTALHIGLFYTGIMAVLYVAAPDLFFFGHAAGMNASEFGPLRATTIVLLRFVAVYCLFDTMNVIFVSAVKGAGDTRFILVTNIIVSPIPVFIGWLGTRHFGAGLIFCWWVITVWIVSLGLIYLGRFLEGSWRSMRVIEQEGEVEAEQVAGFAAASGKPGTVPAVD